MDLVKAYHFFNRDKKEGYLISKYSSDGKKLILQEKGPLKKKTGKTFSEKSIIYLFIYNHWNSYIYFFLIKRQALARNID